LKVVFLKIFHVLKTKGMLLFIKLVFETIYFRFYSRKFKRARGVYLKKGFMISGHKYISLGDNFRAGFSLRLEAIESYAEQEFNPKLTIGNNTFINDYVHIGCVNDIKIGNDVLLASKIYIGDHNHGCYSFNDLDLHQNPEIPPSKRLLSSNASICIEDNVWIGESVSVLPGAHIGRCSIIGANSVVRGIIPPFSIAAGIPAIVVKKYCHVDQVWKSIK